MSGYAGRWTVWDDKGCKQCGTRTVHVYPSVCETVKCECGTWQETPQFDEHGALIHERGKVSN